MSNKTRMTNITGEERTYRATEGGTLVHTDQGKKLLSNFMVPPTLVLKEGAQVNTFWHCVKHIHDHT